MFSESLLLENNSAMELAYPFCIPMSALHHAARAPMHHNHLVQAANQPLCLYFSLSAQDTMTCLQGQGGLVSLLSYSKERSWRSRYQHHLAAATDHNCNRRRLYRNYSGNTKWLFHYFRFSCFFYFIYEHFQLSRLTSALIHPQLVNNKTLQDSISWEPSRTTVETRTMPLPSIHNNTTQETHPQYDELQIFFAWMDFGITWDGCCSFNELKGGGGTLNTPSSAEKSILVCLVKRKIEPKFLFFFSSNH
jgi:hypothetical protein